MKNYILVILMTGLLFSCAGEDDSEIVPVQFDDVNTEIDSECFNTNQGDNCFVLDIENINVDTLRSNLLKVLLNGNYNSSINTDQIYGIETRFTAFKNGAPVQNPSTAAYSSTANDGRWSVDFNYGFFAGYDSMNLKVSLQCILSRNINGQQVDTIYNSAFTEVTTFIP